LSNLPSKIKVLSINAEAVTAPRDAGHRPADPIRCPRFCDLQALGIVNNWPTLRRLIRDHQFPPGIMLGNRRIWPEPLIAAWLASRPQYSAPVLRGAARRNAERAALKREVSA
jgi:predicted DNA-binding transcriptional regulator AlpA